MTLRIYQPIATGDFDLAEQKADFGVGPTYSAAELIIRIEGRPLGQLRVQLTSGTCSGESLTKLSEAQFGTDIAEYELRNWLLRNQVELTLPSATIAICTRNRTEDLAKMLPAVLIQVPAVNVLVIDNAPSTDATKALLLEKFPGVRYVRETRPGLDWARNRAVIESTTELILFVDDDAFPDARWSHTVRALFARDPWIGAVTGLTVAHELETEAQNDFERTGAFNRGYKRKWGIPVPTSVGWSAGHLMGIGDFGVGANMAFRRTALIRAGLFDPALDAGTITGGAGDLNMMFRVVKHGFKIVYEPAAIVRHRHRRTNAELKRQLFANGAVIGYLQSLHDSFPEERDAYRYISGWIARYLSHQLLNSLGPAPRIRSDLAWAETKGYAHAIAARTYRRAQRKADELSSTSSEPKIERGLCPLGLPPIVQYAQAIDVDIDDGIDAWVGLTGSQTAIVNFRYKGSIVSVGHILNGGRGASDEQLVDALVESLR